MIILQVTKEELKTLISDAVKTEIAVLKKDFQPKTPPEYLTVVQVAEMFHVNRGTIWGWTKRGILKSYGVARRVYYRREDIEAIIIELQ